MYSSYYTLYWNPYSICSLMVRYTLETRGPPKDGELDWNIENKAINIFAGEQISEHFLCEVNPKGEVPVLANPDRLPQPLADSKVITFYIIKHFPRLQPPALRNEIVEGLAYLHDIDYFALSFTGNPDVIMGLRHIAERDLADPNSSPRYKKALEAKLKIIQRSNIEALSPERVAEAEQQTRELLADMVARKTKSKGKGPWIFGTEDPTALDAHLVIFLTRLQDVGRHEFIPAELQVYADMAMETPAFNAVFLDVPSGRTVPQKGLKKLLYSNGVE